ncbi:MAG: sigma-70 family RNA polymerase sigma factor, partial [Oscillatoria princeps RMCB-10]|nr:sigma-70 family RNA polymerase sigma factor [Oscillatoria princeps RMCB-10]
MGGAIDELPPRLREPIRLHYYQEKSYLEIALELGISYGNVRKRMSQARAILKERLSEFMGEEDDVPPEPRKGRKSEKGTLAAPAVGESLPWVLPVGSGEPVGAALYALQGEPASFEPSVEGVLGIVAGGQLRDEPHPPTPSPRAGRGSLRGFGSRGKSFNYPSTVQRLEDGALGIVAGGQLRDEPHPPTPSPRAGRGSLSGFWMNGKSFHHRSTVECQEEKEPPGIVAGGQLRD